MLEAGKHPNADRLQLCSVDVGEGEPRQIVCGAWNFSAGATVAVALPGAVLPDGRTLERAKLRGSVSDGMILSEQELELGDDHAGIIVLPDEWEAGAPLSDALPLSDVVLELETTHNRPDLLGVYGIAREVAAIFDLELAPPPGVDPEPAGDEPVQITIDDLDGCPRYIGRLFRDVTVGAVAALAQGPARRGGHAPDLERRRRDELRHARARAARCTRSTSTRSPAAGSACGARRRASACGRSTGRSARSSRRTS